MLEDRGSSRQGRNPGLLTSMDVAAAGGRDVRLTLSRPAGVHVVAFVANPAPTDGSIKGAWVCDPIITMRMRMGALTEEH